MDEVYRRAIADLTAQLDEAALRRVYNLAQYLFGHKKTPSVTVESLRER